MRRTLNCLQVDVFGNKTTENAALRQRNSRCLSRARLHYNGKKHFLLFYETFCRHADAPRSPYPSNSSDQRLYLTSHTQKNNDEKANIPLDVHMMNLWLFFSWIKTDCNDCLAECNFDFRYLFTLNSISSFSHRPFIPHVSDSIPSQKSQRSNTYDICKFIHMRLDDTFRFN